MKKKNHRSTIEKTEQNSIDGEKILKTLKSLLERCEKSGLKIGYPGEGGERPFRHWLAVDLLEKVLKWPSNKVIVGERFDILLQDSAEFPIVTIETKAPYRKASKKERKNFEDRLSGFGTLRTVYFTNGNEWERLEIFSPKGKLEIREQIEFNLEKATPEEDISIKRNTLSISFLAFVVP
ncbi:MAG: hypothetical protein WBF32_08590 [Candidatus Aminicenantaceae bacterium]